MGKYDSGLSCRWALFTAWAFGFKLPLIFHRVEIWRIFMVGIGTFRVLIKTRLNMDPYSSLKPTKVGFIFISSNSLSRAEDLAAVNHVTQAVWAEVFKSRALVERREDRVHIDRLVSIYSWVESWNYVELFSKFFFLLFPKLRVMEPFTEKHNWFYFNHKTTKTLV